MFDRLSPRFFPPFGHVLDRHRALGVKRTLTAAWATHREFIGQRAEMLNGNGRSALLACNHAALIGGLLQQLAALCRHWTMSPFSVGRRCRKMSAVPLRTRPQFCETRSAPCAITRARPISVPFPAAVGSNARRGRAIKAASRTDQISTPARRARSGHGKKRGRDRRSHRCNPCDQSRHTNIRRDRRRCA